tara:strand:- start:306 stop:899 length:594 start_codon:yes stop_codon:yes gene_type:complete
MSHTFDALDQGVFDHYKGIYSIVDLIDRAETGGTVRRLQAQSLIREYNERNGTRIGYAEVLHRCADHIPAFDGDWVVFTDNSRSILHQIDPDWEIEEALYGASMDVKWAILWDPSEAVVLVYRSPVLKDCERIDPEFLVAHGMSRGDVISFALPAEIEGAVRQDMDRQITPEPVRDLVQGRDYETVCITEFLPWLRK